MTSIASISLSGMTAAQTAMSVSAFNIANLGVDGFHRQQVAQSTMAPAGVSTHISEAETAGSDLTADMVDLLQAKNSFLANLAVFKIHDRMTGALLDAVA